MQYIMKFNDEFIMRNNFLIGVMKNHFLLNSESSFAVQPIHPKCHRIFYTTQGV